MSDLLRGGLGDNRPDSDFDPQQLQAGITVEMEHTDNADVAKEIAKDHLTEDPHYYATLQKGWDWSRGSVQEHGGKYWIEVDGHRVFDFPDKVLAQRMLDRLNNKAGHSKAGATRLSSAAQTATNAAGSFRGERSRQNNELSRAESVARAAISASLQDNRASAKMYHKEAAEAFNKAAAYETDMGYKEFAAVLSAATKAHQAAYDYRVAWSETNEKNMGDSIHKSLKKGVLYGTDDDEMSATFVLSTAADDRDGETVDPEGGDFTEYSRNPVVAFNHDTDDFPIGTSADREGKVAIWVDDVTLGGETKRALLGKCYFSKANPKGRLSYEMVKEGTLRGCSISFLPTGDVSKNSNGGNHYGSWKLLEWSICPIGSNPDAVTLKKLKRLKPFQKAFYVGDEVTADGERAKIERVREGEDGKEYFVRLIDDPELTDWLEWWQISKALVSKGADIIPYSPSLKITNIAQLPRGTGAKYLEVLDNGDGTLIAVQWRRKGEQAAPGHKLVEFSRGKSMHKLYTKTLSNGKRAGWVHKAAEGPLDEETQAHIEEMGLDDVRIEDEAPPPSEGYEEQKAYEPRQVDGKWWVMDGGTKIAGPYDTENGARASIIELDTPDYKSMDGDSENELSELKRIKSDLEDAVLQEVPKLADADEETVDMCAKSISGDPSLVARAKRLVMKKVDVQQESPGLIGLIQGKEAFSVFKDNRRVAGPFGTRQEAIDARRRLLSENPDWTKRLQVKSCDTGPVGYRALKTWLKAIEDELPNIEQTDVLKAANSATKLLKQAMKRAYKELANGEEDSSLPEDDDAGDIEVDEITEKAANPEGWDTSLQAMVRNIKEYIKRARRQGTTGMSRGNLRQVVSTDGLTIPPAFFDKLLDAAIEQAGVGSFITGKSASQGVSKRLSKSDRMKLKDVMDYLEDVSNATDTPKRYSAGMKLHAQNLKALTDDPMPETDEPTPEQEEEMELAMKSLSAMNDRLTDTFFRHTGRRF